MSENTELMELSRLARGDESAWTAFWGDHAPRLMAVAGSRLRRWGITASGAQEVSEELAAECALLLVQAVADGRIQTGVRRYSSGIMRNLVRQWARRRQLEPLEEEVARHQESVLDLQIAEDEVTRSLQQIRRALNRVRLRIMRDLVDNAYRFSFRTSPALHLLALDLAGAGGTELAVLGRAAGREAPSQLSKLRSAAEERARTVLAEETKRALSDSFFQTRVFRACWTEVGAGCVEETELAWVKAPERRNDLERHRKSHLDTVRCAECREALDAPAHAPAELQRLSLILIRSTIASLRGSASQPEG